MSTIIRSFDDGREELIVNGTFYLIRKGWKQEVKELAKKYFKKYKLLIKKNVFCLYIKPKYHYLSKYRNNIEEFNEKVKEIKQNLKVKIYYDFYFL